jgi:hypothetical protein
LSPLITVSPPPPSPLPVAPPPDSRLLLIAWSCSPYVCRYHRCLNFPPRQVWKRFKSSNGRWTSALASTLCSWTGALSILSIRAVQVIAMRVII